MWRCFPHPRRLVRRLLAESENAEETSLSGAASALFLRVLGLIIVFLVIPVSMGFPELLFRQISVYREAKSWDLLKGLLITSKLIVFLLSVGVVAGSTLVAVGTIGENSDIGPAFLLALFLIPLLALGQLRSASLRGLQKIASSRTPRSFV